MRPFFRPRTARAVSVFYFSCRTPLMQRDSAILRRFRNRRGSMVCSHTQPDFHDGLRCRTGTGSIHLHSGPERNQSTGWEEAPDTPRRFPLPRAYPPKRECLCPSFPSQRPDADAHCRRSRSPHTNILMHRSLIV